MNGKPLRVIVVGGGIGGLCLAQGLKKGGVDVAVYERDRAPADRLQGYRLHINPAGSRALARCLPPSLWEDFVATAGKPGGFAFLDERLRELVAVEEDLMYWEASDPAEDHHAVDRLTLRRLLLAGMEGEVRFGKRFERYERSAEGRVTAFFADGSSATGDVLVGADGAGSVVRKQRLPQALRVETGATAVGLKLPLTEESRAWLPPRLTAGMSMVMAPDPYFLFTAVFDRGRGPLGVPGGDGGIVESNVPRGERPDGTTGYRNYVLCAFVGRREAFPRGVGDLDADGVRGVVEAMIGGWHPKLRRLVAEADPESVMLMPLTRSVRIEPWQSTNVTLLGDAIHGMPPTGGLGGNAALRDASLLCGRLVAVDRGEAPLLPAVHEFEAVMVEHGFAAVDSAMRTMWLGLVSSRLALAGMRAWFRACGAVPSLRRATFRDTWAEHARARPWERARPGAVAAGGAPPDPVPSSRGDERR